MAESKLFMDVVRENKGIVISYLSAMFVLWAGVITAAIGFLNLDFSMVWFGAGLFAVSWIIKLPQIIFTRRMGKKADIERAEAQRKQRQKELARIRKSMTPGEWEMYKIQLENQKLLKDIKNKPSQQSGPRATYGFTQEIGD